MKYSFLRPLILLLLVASGAWAHGLSQADQQAMVDGGLLRYIWLGATHMLTGYDHLLFLFGVIFFLTKFKEIIKFITAFTLGHSITLVFATFFHITANYFLIDALIALTVCYKGFDNLGGFRKAFNINPPNLLAAVFLFGLIHGFGLSTRLQQLPLGDHGLLSRILAFNVGVEIGQVMALSVLVLVLAGWRKTESYLKWSQAANFALIGAGLLLFVMQMTGYFQNHSHEDAHTHGYGSDEIRDSGKSNGQVEEKDAAGADTLPAADTLVSDSVLQEKEEPMKQDSKVPHSHGHGEAHTH